MSQINDGKRLRSMHPLYTRVGGDVLWELFLESGYSEEECGLLLDESIEQMHKVLSTMRAIEKGESEGFVFSLGKGKICKNCAKLDGKKVLSGKNKVEGLFLKLPPFAVGCPLSCRPLALDEEDEKRPEADYSLIKYHLLCPEFASSV